MHKLPAAILLISLVCSAAPVPVLAQAPGFADITRPQSGEALTGLVTIEGSAAHPAFLYYELAFAYQPNPTDTWFILVDQVSTPVTDGRLGLWDTSGITDGVYQLRLRVHLENGGMLEAIAEGLRVRNTTPLEPAPERPVEARPSPTASPVIPLESPTPHLPAPTSQDGGEGVFQVFVYGGLLGVFALLGLAGYQVSRKAARIHQTSARSRRSESRSERNRRLRRS